MKWAKVTVRTTGEAAEGVLEVMHTLAGGAVQSGDHSTAIVQAFVPASRALTLMRRIRERLKALREAGIATDGSRVAQRTIAHKDWERAWQRDFRMQRIAPGLVVVPPWERYRTRPGEVAVIINPGLAFGTGQHPTTEMCLKTLKGFVRKGDIVADVGTGSGILAIAAVKMGARQAWAIDNDPVALAAARENARRNRVEPGIVIRRGDLLRGVRRKFHMVVANLTAEQLIEMAPDVPHRLRPGAIFISSGIAGGKAAAVRRALLNAGLAPTTVERQGEWRTVICRMPESKRP